MKRNIFTVCALLALMVSTHTIYATQWWVSESRGNDDDNNGSYTSPFETIERAVYASQSGDTITIEAGNYVPAKFETTLYYPGGDFNADQQILLSKANVTLNKYGGTKPTIIGYDPDSENQMHNIIKIWNSGISLQNLKFDGFNTEPDPDQYVELNNAIGIHYNGDDTEIKYCEFRNFGYCWSDTAFYSIIGPSGAFPYLQDIDNIELKYCTFTNNPFQSCHAHEFYLTYCDDAIIEGNTIYNNGEGDPIKIKNNCRDTIIKDNTVYGAWESFVLEETVIGGTFSTNTQITGNTFTDHPGIPVIDFDWNTYDGPVQCNNHADYPFISVWKDNTIDSLALFSTTDSTANNIYATTSDANSAFVAI